MALALAPPAAAGEALKPASHIVCATDHDGNVRQAHICTCGIFFNNSPNACSLSLSPRLPAQQHAMMCKVSVGLHLQVPQL